jgi:hypothetical protein
MKCEVVFKLITVVLVYLTLIPILTHYHNLTLSHHTLYPLIHSIHSLTLPPSLLLSHTLFPSLLLINTDFPSLPRTLPRFHTNPLSLKVYLRRLPTKFDPPSNPHSLTPILFSILTHYFDLNLQPSLSPTILPYLLSTPNLLPSTPPILALTLTLPHILNAPSSYPHPNPLSLSPLFNPPSHSTTPYPLTLTLSVTHTYPNTYSYPSIYPCPILTFTLSTHLP